MIFYIYVSDGLKKLMSGLISVRSDKNNMSAYSLKCCIDCRNFNNKNMT